MCVGTGTKSVSKLKGNYVCRNRNQINKYNSKGTMYLGIGAKSVSITQKEPCM